MQCLPNHVLQRLNILIREAGNEDGRHLSRERLPNLGLQLLVNHVGLGDGQQALLVQQVGVKLLQLTD